MALLGTVVLIWAMACTNDSAIAVPVTQDPSPTQPILKMSTATPRPENTATPRPVPRYPVTLDPFLLTLVWQLGEYTAEDIENRALSTIVRGTGIGAILRAGKINE